MGKKKTDGPTQDERDGRKKKSVGVRMDEEFQERIRNLVYILPREYTFQKVVEDGVMREMERLEKEYNGGKPAPQRPSELPGSSK
jgi:hypothetical protein